MMLIFEESSKTEILSKMKEFLFKVSSLKLDYTFKIEKDKYQLYCEIKDSDQYDKIFTNLSRSEELDEIDDAVVASLESTVLVYESVEEPFYTILLSSKMTDDPNSDSFNLTMIYRKEENSNE